MDGIGFGIIRILLILVVFGSMLFLAFVTTKYVGSKAGRAMKGKYIHVVESVSLGLDKQIYLVKVADQHVLIASAGKNIEYLTTVKMEDYEVQEPQSENPVFDFKSIFEKYIQSFKNKKSEKTKSAQLGEEMDDAKKSYSFKKNLDEIKRLTKGMENKVKGDGVESTYEE